MGSNLSEVEVELERVSQRYEILAPQVSITWSYWVDSFCMSSAVVISVGIHVALKAECFRLVSAGLDISSHKARKYFLVSIIIDLFIISAPMALEF